MSDYSHSMQYIYLIEGGYWVRFTRNSDQILIAKCFFKNEYKTLEKALMAAKLWRNNQHRKLKLSCTKINDRLYKQWSDYNRFIITGLTWQEFERDGYINSYLVAYSSFPADKKCIYRRRSIKKYGLKGAFELAVAELESMRTATYPKDIKAKAFKRIKKEFNSYSVSDFK